MSINRSFDTLELYVTAVSSSLNDRQLGSVRQDGTVNRVMEGIKRSMGMPVRKKLAIEGLHIAAWLEMESPGKDGVAWTAEYATLQWPVYGSVGVSLVVFLTSVGNLAVASV